MPNFPPGGENVSFCLLPTYNCILLNIKDPSVRLRVKSIQKKIGKSGQNATDLLGQSDFFALNFFL